jgi:hypothetical protein
MHQLALNLGKHLSLSNFTLFYLESLLSSKTLYFLNAPHHRALASLISVAQFIHASLKCPILPYGQLPL